MTREELVSQILTHTRPTIPLGERRKIIAGLLIDYEREQWQPGGWPPNDTNSKLVIGGDGDGRWYSLAYCVLGGDGWIHTSGVPMPQRVEFWRALPPGPEGGK